MIYHILRFYVGDPKWLRVFFIYHCVLTLILFICDCFDHSLHKHLIVTLFSHRSINILCDILIHFQVSCYFLTQNHVLIFLTLSLFQTSQIHLLSLNNNSILLNNFLSIIIYLPGSWARPTTKIFNIFQES